jgi:hypothetical protein
MTGSGTFAYISANDLVWVFLQDFPSGYLYPILMSVPILNQKDTKYTLNSTFCVLMISESLE